MPTYDEIQGFRINKMSKNVFDQLKAEGNIKSNEVYLVLRGNDPTGLPDYDNKAGYVLKVNADGTDVEWQRDVNNAAVFENISSMIATLNNADKKEFAIGQSIFIADTNVPDFWIYSIEDNQIQGKVPTEYDETFYQFGYFKLSLLEIGKVIFNSNITYSETEPDNANIGDIWLTPAEEMINELPEYSSDDNGKVLQVQSNGSLNWKKIAPVEANPPLDGTEQDLTSVKIDGVLYELKGQGGEGSVEMIFSDSPNENGTPLRTITIGEDIWSIPLGGTGEGGNIDLTGYATEDYVNSQGFLKQKDLPSLTPYATIEYTDSKIANLIGSAPETLDSLQELASAVQENHSIVDALTDAIGNKQDTLVSKVNIKSINGQSIVGAGNIEITAGSGVVANPGLTGLEEELTGLEIDGSKFAIPHAVLSLSDQSTTQGYPLRSITVGDYVWRIDGPNVDLSNYATTARVEEIYQVLSNNKQDKLNSSNFKTINGISVFGPGEITLNSGSGNIDLTGYVTEQWVFNQGYLKSDALTDYAFKAEIPKNISQLNNDLSFITSEYVDNSVNNAITNLIGTAPSNLDTIYEIAAAVKNNQNLVDTLNASINNKADKNNTVLLDTAQTINSIKTFNSNIHMRYSNSLETKSPKIVLSYPRETFLDGKANYQYATLNLDDNGVFLTLGENTIVSSNSVLDNRNNNAISIGLNQSGELVRYNKDETAKYINDKELKTINGESLIGIGDIKTFNSENYYTKLEINALLDNKIGAAFNAIDSLIGG